jgi:hypothetical protein
MNYIMTVACMSFKLSTSTSTYYIYHSLLLTHNKTDMVPSALYSRSCAL